MLNIHIDTDFGGDSDDLCALVMLLKWPGVNITGITTVTEHAGKRAGYVRYVLDKMGRNNIPVASGADVSMGNLRFIPNLPSEEINWPEAIPAFKTPLDEALELLRRNIENGSVVVAIGPYTNLFLLERKYPGTLSKAKLFLMGGLINYTEGEIPKLSNNYDYNIQQDVIAAEYVFKNSDPTLIPLEVTIKTALRRKDLKKLEESGSIGKLIAGQSVNAGKELKIDQAYGLILTGGGDDIINMHHDPLACAVALGWPHVTIKEQPLKIEVKNGWLYERVDQAGKLFKVVVQADTDLFNNFWLDLVTK